MKRHSRIASAVAGLAIVGFYSACASAQIATPVVSTVAGVPADIPFDLYRGSRIVLRGSVNGNATEMLLDSGAGVTTIDRAFARKIGLPKGTAVEALGSGGTDKAELVQNVTIDAGNLRLSGVTVAVIDLEMIAKTIGRPVPVILGRELFTNSILGLDFDRNVLTLARPADFSPPSGATEVKLKRAGTMFRFPLSVSGLPPVEAVLDIGNGGALSLSREYQEAAPALHKLPYAVGLSGGVGGLHETKKVTLPKVEFAGFTFNGVPADLGAMSGGPYEGRANAGIQLLKPFKVTLDLGHDRMWLQRTARPAEFQKDRAGIFVALESDHFNVMYVTAGSPAAAAGLKKGDRIVAVDGQKVGPGFYGSTKGSWARAAAGTRVPVTTADGRTVTLTLADYY